MAWYLRKLVFVVGCRRRIIPENITTHLITVQETSSEKHNFDLTIHEEYQLLLELNDWMDLLSLHYTLSEYLFNNKGHSDYYTIHFSFSQIEYDTTSNREHCSPAKAEPGVRPSFWQMETNQYTPTATWATSSSTILATMLEVRWSPKPVSLLTSRGPASSPRAS